MGKERFTDHEGNEAPDFEVEEVEEEDKDKGKGKGKSDDDEPEEEFEDDDETEDKPRRPQPGEDDDEEEEEDEPEEEDDEKARLREENEQLRQAGVKALHDKTEGELEQAKYLSSVIDRQIEDIRNSLVEAKKDEDVEKQAKLENDLEKAKEAKAQAAELVSGATQKLEQIKQGAGAGGGQGDGYRTPKARQWAEKNPWLRKPGFEAEKAALLAIDQQLAKEGLNPNSDRYFRELSKRLNRKMPGLKVTNLDGKPVVTSRRKPGGDGKRSPHTQAGTSGTNAKGKRPGKPRMEPGDREKMRRFQLDPDDPKAVKHFLRAKAETAAAEARRED